MGQEVSRHTRPKPEELPALVARVDDLLELWSGDLRQIAPERLQELHRQALAAAASGEIKRLAEELQAPATERETAMAMAELVNSFPPSREQDLTIFGANLKADVWAMAPNRVALVAACTHLRRTRDMIPSIRLVLDALAEKDEACRARTELLEKLPGRVALAGQILGEDRG